MPFYRGNVSVVRARVNSFKNEAPCEVCVPVLMMRSLTHAIDVRVNGTSLSESIEEGSN